MVLVENDTVSSAPDTTSSSGAFGEARPAGPAASRRDADRARRPRLPGSPPRLRPTASPWSCCAAGPDPASPVCRVLGQGVTGRDHPRRRDGAGLGPSRRHGRRRCRSGGDLALRYRDERGRPLDQDLGLVSLAALSRRSTTTTPIGPHLQVPLGGPPILVGVARPEQVGALGPAWGPLAQSLAAYEGDVLADCGRVTAGAAVTRSSPPRTRCSSSCVRRWRALPPA